MPYLLLFSHIGAKAPLLVVMDASSVSCRLSVSVSALVKVLNRKSKAMIAMLFMYVVMCQLNKKRYKDNVFS